MSNNDTSFTAGTYASTSPLGHSSDYVQAYTPSLLHAIARADYRATVLGYSAAQPMFGADVWQCYELSWLNPQGKPVAKHGRLLVPVESPIIVESKSLKLYLNSLNQHTFASNEAVVQTVSRDLSELLGAKVTLELLDLHTPWDVISAAPIGSATSSEHGAIVQLDELDVACTLYQRSPQLLNVTGQQVTNEVVQSDLLCSNCPVTSQPDWATVTITYSGQKLDYSELLQYIVSFRQHNGFHEQTVEQIYTDLVQLPQLQAVTVLARYTRRGGIAISAYRSNQPASLDVVRLLRQ